MALSAASNGRNSVLRHLDARCKPTELRQYQTHRVIRRCFSRQPCQYRSACCPQLPVSASQHAVFKTDDAKKGFRTSTLYGAAEQAVGGASAVAALSIASIIGPQVTDSSGLTEFIYANRRQIFPAKDEPWYLPGFSAACATLACTCIGYASLPLWYDEQNPL